jgi:hypothetical protein
MMLPYILMNVGSSAINSLNLFSFFHSNSQGPHGNIVNVTASKSKRFLKNKHMNSTDVDFLAENNITLSKTNKNLMKQITT